MCLIHIQHVGSTSIVGLMAKPIINIEVGVNFIQYNGIIVNKYFID